MLVRETCCNFVDRKPLLRSHAINEVTLNQAHEIRVLVWQPRADLLFLIPGGAAGELQAIVEQPLEELDIGSIIFLRQRIRIGHGITVRLIVIIDEPIRMLLI